MHESILDHHKETNIDLFGHFLLDLENPIGADSPKLLFHWLVLAIEGDPVLEDFWIDSRHIFIGPSKNIFELF